MVEQVLSLELMCLAQGHNAVVQVRFEPIALWSLVNHSTTEPLPSPSKRSVFGITSENEMILRKCFFFEYFLLKQNICLLLSPAKMF